MLRIKDTVNLTALEKFGFKLKTHLIDHKIYVYESKTLIDHSTCLLIDEYTHAIKVLPSYYDISDILDLIFQLIQAGLIEKIDED